MRISVAELSVFLEMAQKHDVPCGKTHPAGTLHTIKQHILL